MYMAEMPTATGKQDRGNKWRCDDLQTEDTSHGTAAFV